jgi:hypothetical protein
MRAWIEDIAKGRLRSQPAHGDRTQKVGDKNQHRLHSREDQGNGVAGRKIVY